MNWFWKTSEEMLIQNQRALNKVMRDLDRERAHLENNEKNVIMDIMTFFSFFCSFRRKWAESYQKLTEIDKKFR